LRRKSPYLRYVLAFSVVFFLLGSLIYACASSPCVSLSKVFAVKVDDAISAMYVAREGRLLVLLGNGTLLAYSEGNKAVVGNLSNHPLGRVGLAYAGIDDLGSMVAVFYGSRIRTFPRPRSVLDGFDLGDDYVVAKVADIGGKYALVVADAVGNPPYDTYLIIARGDGYVENVAYVGHSFPGMEISIKMLNNSCIALVSVGGIRYVCMGEGPYAFSSVPGVVTGTFLGKGLVAGTVDGRVLIANSTRYREVAYLGGTVLRVLRAADRFLVVVNNEGKVVILDRSLNTVFCGRIAERVMSASIDSSGEYLTLIEPLGLPTVRNGRPFFRTRITVFKIEARGEAPVKNLDLAGESLLLLAPLTLALPSLGGALKPGEGKKRYVVVVLMFLLLLGLIAYVLFTSEKHERTGRTPSTATTPAISTSTHKETKLRNVTVILKPSYKELAKEFIAYLTKETTYAIQDWELTLTRLNKPIAFPVRNVGEVLKGAGLSIKTYRLPRGYCMFEVRAPQQLGFPEVISLDLSNCSTAYGNVDPQALRNFLIRLRRFLQIYQGTLGNGTYCCSKSIFSEVLRAISTSSGLNLSPHYVNYGEYLQSYGELLSRLTKLFTKKGSIWVNLTLTDYYAEGRSRKISLAVSIPRALVEIYNQTTPIIYPLITPEDPVIRHIVKALRTIVWSDQYPYKEWRLANLLTQIPQQLKYVKEVPSWPLLTLVKGEGLCAARTYLGISLLEAAGIPSGELVREGTPSHSYLAVSVELPPWINDGGYLTEVRLPGGNVLNSTMRFYPVELTVNITGGRVVGEWRIYRSTEPYVTIYPYTRPNLVYVLSLVSSIGEGPH